MAPNDAAAGERLDAYLDGVVRRRPPAPTGLDPALAEAVRRVHALGASAARPDPSFVARLEADLMSMSMSMPKATAESAATPVLASAPFPAVNGHAPRFVRSPPVAQASSGADRSRWPITQVLVATVLLLSLAVGFAANSVNRAEPPVEPPGGMGPRAFIPAVASPEGTGRGSFAATIPPGWRIEQIAELFAAESGRDDGFDAFLRAAAEFDRGGYPFLAALPPGSTLEGYLLPGTYVVERDDPARTVEQMVDAFDQAFTPEMGERVAQMNLTIQQVVILAALVEREAQVPDERPIIADVYIKRWEQSADGWKLEADPTVQYVVGPRDGEWWPEIIGDDLFVESPYNTYQRAGLPPGPIANPSLASIQAVLFPESTPYYFFVPTGDGSGEHSFAVTAEEQAANVERYREAIAMANRGTPSTRDAAHDDACTVELRANPIVLEGRAGTLVGLPGTPTARLSVPSDVPPARFGDPLGFPEELLPTGEPASAEAVVGLRDTLVQRAVCRGERALAVYSDDYFRRGEALRDSNGVETTYVLVPVPIRGVEAPEDVPLRDARELPDGRVGAVVEERAFAGDDDFLGNFYVFVEEDGRWLIDEVVVVRRPAAVEPPFPFPTPTSTPAATRPAPTPTVDAVADADPTRDPAFDGARPLEPTSRTETI